MTVVVPVWGSVGMLVVLLTLLKKFFCLRVLYICVRDVMDVVFSVCIVRHGVVGARVWEV